MLSDYGFGHVMAGGERYEKDLIVMPGGRVISPWWRTSGHSLAPDDLRELEAEPPEALVIGTGAMGVMRVPRETIEWLEGLGVRVLVHRTAKAVDEYNALIAQGVRAAAALHLTC